MAGRAASRLVELLAARIVGALLTSAPRPDPWQGAPQQVDEFLAEWVAPVLERYAGDLGDGAPELHV